MIRRIYKDSLLGGLAGIGITLTIVVPGFPMMHILEGLYFIMFSFIIGFLITFSNKLLVSLASTALPVFFRKLSPKLVLYCMISSAIYFLCSRFFVFFLSKKYEIIASGYFSFGIGITSVMIALFFFHNNKKAELVRLEKENRRLAVLDERNRIARELHDSVSQNLFGVNLNLNTLSLLLDQNPEKAKEVINYLQGMLQEIQTEMRLLIYELRPVILAEKDFFEAVESLTALYRVRFGLDIYLNIMGEEEHLGEQTKANLCWILQESLNNIVKYARESKIMVNMAVRNNNGELIIHDDGWGFAIKEDNGEGQSVLKDLRERVKQIKGILEIQSRDGKGTILSVKF